MCAGVGLSRMAAPWQHAAVWRSIGTCMTTQRQSYETGHKPKCLVIVDDTAEWDRAVYYASRWAIRGGRRVGMPRVIETEDPNQQVPAGRRLERGPIRRGLSFGARGDGF